MYRNGVEDNPYTGGTCTAIADSVTSTSPFEIGKGSWGYFNGLIDDVRIYNRALTGGFSGSEVSNLYNGGSGCIP